MVPYRGRFALRLARICIAVLCAGWYLRSAGLEPNLVMAAIAAHALFAIFALTGVGFETPVRGMIALPIDAAYYGLWAWLAPQGFQAPLACAYLLTSTTLLQARVPAFITIAGALLIALVIPPFGPLAWSALGMGAIAAGMTVYRTYLEGRMSTTLRHNVIIRSQAQSAREAERQRIAADFHDGPLQSFIGFQLRLEIIRRQMERNLDQAKQELLQLQELCKGQVTDLRSFVRSMRPPDEGMGLAASLQRMADSLQRDAGITSKFTGEELHDPQEVEVSLEILQIVREAFNNIQKHSGATRVDLSAHRSGRFVQIVVNDNGSGFPFAGTFTLEELDAARLGPISIKRRIKMLAGELAVESRPGEGAKLTFRVPF